MRLCSLILFVCPTVVCQTVPQPLTQVEACRRFEESVVRIEAGPSSGTGFIIDPAGWIITAMHMVAGDSSNIQVHIHGVSKPVTAELVSPSDNVTRAGDIAVLKVDKTNLPYLQLGSESVVEDGSPVAVIGFPLSAVFEPKPVEIPKFCLSGTVVAQVAFPLGGLNYRHSVYFQGVSVKGISGAPIISLVSGKVIGIVSTKLTGVSGWLEKTGADLVAIQNTPHATMLYCGQDFTRTLTELVTTLDNHLANGLGSGTGASDAANALEKAKQDYKRHQRAK
jgi:S1-C subfamily serine protease